MVGVVGVGGGKLYGYPLALVWRERAANNDSLGFDQKRRPLRWQAMEIEVGPKWLMRGCKSYIQIASLRFGPASELVHAPPARPRAEAVGRLHSCSDLGGGVASERVICAQFRQGWLGTASTLRG